MKARSGWLVVALLVVSLTGCFSTEDRLAKEMKSKDPNTRSETATQLGEVGTPRALQILQLHEDDPDFTVRDKVRASIKKIQKQTFFK